MQLLNTQEAADAVRLARMTLVKMRVEGRGPVFTKVGRRVFYRPEDLERWIMDGRRENTQATRPPKESRRRATG